MKKYFLVTLCLLLGLCQSVFASESTKSRVIILTDIGAEVDDTESLVRLLLYSNVIDIEGLIATTSVWQKDRVRPDLIKVVVDAYGKIQINLDQHESGFPSKKNLLTKLKMGLPTYGMLGVGDGKNSQGSDWIIKNLEAKDDRPLWISVWGGVNTLAQALFDIRKNKTVDEAKKLIAKLRVYTISDQDDSGIWIRTEFPDLFYIVDPGDDYGTATWSGINSWADGLNNYVFSNKWLAENIQQGHGPMGAEYVDVAYGMEGDTPSWLSLIPNGLNQPERPNWGGWGGRYELVKPDFAKLKKGNSGVPFEPEPRAIWAGAVDSYTPYIDNEFGRTVKPSSITITNNKVSVMRWREDFQNDFAARMNWTIKSYKETNHPPVPVLAMPEEITVKSGDKFVLDASGTTDPDKDSLGYLWFHYPEEGTYKKFIAIDSAENIARVFVVAPVVTQKETAHFILKVTDKGEPPLSRYKRVIVNIVPK